MNILLALFGKKQTVRFECDIEEDDNIGYVGKIYVDTFNVGNERIIEEIKNHLLVETGKHPKNVKIIAVT